MSQIKYADSNSSESVAFTLPVARHAAKQHCKCTPTRTDMLEKLVLIDANIANMNLKPLRS